MSLTRRRVLLPALVVAVCVGSLIYALRLDADAGAGTLSDQSSSAGKATKRFHEQFGEEPITVLVKGRAADGNLPGILLTQDIDRIRGLEGCLSGNLPPGAQPPAPACAKLAESKPIKVVQGPGTFINESARQIAGRFDAIRSRRVAKAERAARKLAAAQGLGKTDQERMARRARQLVNLEFKQDALRLALAYGFTGAPAINNPYFVLKLVFEPSLGFETPKSRFAYLFPSSSTALIQARPRSGLSPSERRKTIALVRDAVASDAFHLQHADYLISGEPVLEEGAAKKISGALRSALVLAILLVGAALCFLFRSRSRLVPLLAGLGGAALTFGAVSLFGGTLTIAQVAALPVMIALTVCFAILIQTRAAATPVIFVAVLVSAIALFVIRLSPVPMVRAFGTDVAVGLVAGCVVMITVGVALLRVDFPELPARWRRAGVRTKGRAVSTARRAGPVAAMGPRLMRRVSRILGRSPLPLGGVVRLTTAAIRIVRRSLFFARRLWARVLVAPVKEPRTVLAVALAAAVLGWVLDAHTDVVTGLERLGPKGAHEVQGGREVTSLTRQAGEVSVVVRAKDLTSPRVIAWMNKYQRRILARHGYSPRKPCRSADVCPALSLTNLFGATPTQNPAQVSRLLGGLPRNLEQAVVSPDRRTGTIGFLVRDISVQKQRDLIDDMRSQLDPPKGVEAELAGPPVLAAEAGSDLQSNRRVLALGAVMAVLAVLLMSLGSFRAALGPIIPVALATGWSGLVVFLSGTPLNALSAAFPAIVVAVTGGLGLIVSDRYRADRARGLAADAVVARTNEFLRRPLLACAVVTLAGFAALTPSDFRMLRDFGFIGVADLLVVLAATAVVLPAALIWAEQVAPIAVPRTFPLVIRRPRRGS